MGNMLANKRLKTWALAFFILCQAPACQAQTSRLDPNRQISLLENRFFYHLYGNDPVEKRLERLELLVFGATQPGTNEERLERLNNSINKKDNKAELEKQMPQAEAPKAEAKEDKTGGTSSQYPILSTLEWRILKKTYPQESMDARLERMETQLFGQASPAMAYADRVERLKKTAGVGLSAESRPKAQPRLGPAPKARPRLPGATGDNMLPQGMYFPDEFRRFAHPLPNMQPFGDFSAMFNQLNQQMQEMMKLPPGAYYFDQKKGDWVNPDTGERIKPGKDYPAPLPAPSRPNPHPAPYYDPNSI